MDKMDASSNGDSSRPSLFWRWSSSSVTRLLLRDGVDNWTVGLRGEGGPSPLCCLWTKGLRGLRWNWELFRREEGEPSKASWSVVATNETSYFKEEVEKECICIALPSSWRLTENWSLSSFVSVWLISPSSCLGSTPWASSSDWLPYISTCPYSIWQRLLHKHIGIIISQQMHLL